jgi:methyltransferase (TIGR00027 family)
MVTFVEPAEPSMTAKVAAIGRSLMRSDHAAPWPLDDPFALPLVGPQWEEIYATLSGLFPEPLRGEMTSAVVARSCYVEDVLARGSFAQYVILGAGLDSFAWRRPDLLRTLRVFEVDHPATQAWKRQRADIVALPRNENHVFAPVDFERETIFDGLAAVGFDPALPTLFSWIAVVPYLTTDAIETTLRSLAQAAPGSCVSLTYAVSRDDMDDVGRQVYERLGAVAAQSGEPLITLLRPAEAADVVARCGLELVEDLDRTELQHRYFKGRADIAPPYTLERALTARVPNQA